MSESAPPDFNRLRSERDAALRELIRGSATVLGCNPEELSIHSRDLGACYCACAEGGPCEHRWDGEPYQCDGFFSRTCSLCGGTAFSHSLRTAP